MPNSNNSKIFISRVSRELGTHAEQLRNDLQGLVEEKVLTQVSFRQEPDTETTLQKLSERTTGVRLSIIRVNSCPFVVSASRWLSSKGSYCSLLSAHRDDQPSLENT